MAVMRFLAALCLLIAVVALVADASPAIYGIGPFGATSLRQHWSGISPKSLEAARASLEASGAGWLWNFAIAPVIGRPTWAVFGIIAIALGYVGRRRHRINVYVN